MSLLVMISMKVTKEEIIQVIRFDSGARMSLKDVDITESNDAWTFVTLR
jgi:hypothetical protein